MDFKAVERGKLSPKGKFFQEKKAREKGEREMERLRKSKRKESYRLIFLLALIDHSLFVHQKNVRAKPRNFFSQKVKAKN